VDIFPTPIYVAVLGTNLINGHIAIVQQAEDTAKVAVLGTNLINGHTGHDAQKRKEKKSLSLEPT